MDVIKDLWYGNICGVEDCSHGASSDPGAFKEYDRIRQALTTQEQREFFDAYVDAIHNAALDWQEDAFRYGVRLGFDLANEIADGARQE